MDGDPPSIVVRWICAEAGFCRLDAAGDRASLAGFSSLPSTNVAPGWMDSPPRMVTGPSLRQLSPSGTTTLWYVPGANVSVHVVVFAAAYGRSRQANKQGGSERSSHEWADASLHEEISPSLGLEIGGSIVTRRGSPCRLCQGLTQLEPQLVSR